MEPTCKSLSLLFSSSFFNSIFNFPSHYKFLRLPNNGNQREIVENMILSSLFELYNIQLVIVK